MTELLALLEQTDLVTLNVLTSWLILLTLWTLRWVTLLGRAGLLTVDSLTSWLTLLALQTIRLVALLEQRGLLTLNRLISWLTLLVLQTLRSIALLEQTRNIKAKISIFQWYFKISFTSLINTLFTDQHSSRGNELQILTLIPLDVIGR